MGMIDNRIVQMTFDNAAFEKKLDQTIKSLSSLQASIDKAGQSNGLQELNATVKKFDMSKMNIGIGGTSKKFLAFSTVAVTALSQITKSVLNTGTQMVKSLSLDLIMGGFDEYETNMRSIQTILANTAADGTNLTMVNAALDELNSYADLTIYNFAEMARNIGTFTAAGVDLKTSTESIKGIANLAAISGSNSGQASTAMYQLSQAIASGTVKLMDWNSVVNAGMGGEVFQNALFETGKTMGTIADVPLTQTFEEWTDAGNTFRGSLQDGWITSEVLTTTLRGFTGEMTDAQLAAEGFSAEQIVNIQKMGTLGIEAATKVRTLSQLFDTAKEAVGSGWSLTFRTVLGDFEEATELFTNLSNGFTKVIEESADRRNTVLATWSKLPGRTFLIEALTNVFVELGRVVTVIKDAFREVFPRKTGEDLYLMTVSFKNFTEKIGPAVSRNLTNIKDVVIGVANGFKIFSEFIGEAISFAVDFFGAFSSGNSKSALDRAGDLGNKLTDLKELLVDEGGIAKFFDKLRDGIEPLKEKIEELKTKFAEIRDTVFDTFEKFKTFGEKVLDFFTRGTVAAGAMGDALSSRFSFITDLLPEFNLDKLMGVAGKIYGKIKDFVSSIVDAFSEAFGAADYDSAFDVLNTGIFGIIAGALAKFAMGDGIFGGIADTLDELTGVLSAMQADIKANIIVKIAGAMLMLAAAMLVLSMIDSVALTKALVAMSVGFGQLVAVMVIMTKLNFGTGAFKLALMAATLVILSVAILALAVAIKIMSTMSLAELGRGLGTTAVGLGLLIAALKLVPTKRILRSAISIAVLAGALVILGVALKIFATMSWEEIGKGLTVVAGALVAFVAALQLMPKKGKVIKSAIAIGILAVSLLIFSASMKILATMSWEEIGKGLAAVIGLLGALVISLNLMPKDMALKAAGLLALATAIAVMTKSVKTLSTMSWEELGKGLAGLAAMLVVLSAALMLMTHTAAGSIALGIAAVGISLLAKAVALLGGVPLMDLVKGIGAIAVILGVLGIAAMVLSPSLPALFALGVAMVLLGTGVLFLGIGLKSAASGLSTFVRLIGTTGETLGLIIQVIFGLIDDLVKGIVKTFGVLLEEGRKILPDLFAFIEEWFTSLFDLVVKMAPKFGEAVKAVVLSIIDVVVAIAPDLYAAGFDLITGFIAVVVENVPKLIGLGYDLITNLIAGITEKIPALATAVAGLIVAFIQGFTDNIGDVIAAGTDLIVAIIEGLAAGLVDYVAAVTDLVVSFIGAISDSLGDIITAGADLIIAFIEGMGENALKVVNAGFETLISFLEGLANSIRENRGDLVAAGVDILDAMFEGVIDGVVQVTTYFTELPGKIIGWLGETLSSLFGTGKNLLEGLYNGMIKFVTVRLYSYITGFPAKILGWFGDGLLTLVDVGKNLIRGLWDGLVSMGGWLTEKITSWIPDNITGVFKSVLKIFSPSRVMAGIGSNVTEGLFLGMQSETDTLRRTSESLADTVVDSFDPDIDALKTTMGRVNEVLALAGDNLTYSPKITPVLDMDRFNKDTSSLNGLLGEQRVVAKGIAQSQNTLEAQRSGGATAGVNSGDVTFEQNIYAPKTLSAAEIYRQTRNQITIAKEELNVR